MKNLSIRVKVSALLGLVLVVVFGLTIINTSYGQKKSIDQLCNESGKEFRAALSQSVEFMMVKGANDELQPALEQMANDKLAKEISIVDYEKKVARSSSKQLIGNTSTDPAWTSVFNSEKDTSFQTVESGEPVFVTYRAFVAQPACQECHDQKGVIGGMKIVKSMLASKDLIAASTRNNVLLAIVSIAILSLGIVVVLNRNIFSPLAKVQEALRLASSGNVDQDVRTDSKNEIGQLLNSIQDLIAYIQRFAGHAKAVAAGNLTDEVEVKGADDVLGNAFQQMLVNLTDIVQQLTENARELASVSTEIAANSEQSSNAASSQASQVNQIATAIEEMTATIIETSKSSGDASDNAKKASDTASSGGEIVASTITGMQNIAQVVRNSSTSIGKLSKSVQEIGSIIEVIDDIADQTNLLALNAAIEAARAGEQGRGFAVVADEVRKLAERTGKATAEITAMIKGIQVQTGEAVTVMDSGIKEVESGKKLADQAGDSLGQIVRMSQQVMDMIQQIATAAEQQSSAAEQISRTVEQISNVTRESATGAQQSSAAAEQLSGQAEVLRQMIGKFHIKGGNSAMLSLAKDDHRNYMKRLRSVIEGKSSVDNWTVVTHIDCRFGKWYYTDGVADYRQFEEFNEIEHPHKLVHAAANDAVAALRREDEAAAKKHFKEAEKASEGVVHTCDAALSALTQKAKV